MSTAHSPIMSQCFMYRSADACVIDFLTVVLNMESHFYTYIF